MVWCEIFFIFWQNLNPIWVLPLPKQTAATFRSRLADPEEAKKTVSLVFFCLALQLNTHTHSLTHTHTLSNWCQWQCFAFASDTVTLGNPLSFPSDRPELDLLIQWSKLCQTSGLGVVLKSEDSATSTRPNSLSASITHRQESRYLWRSFSKNFFLKRKLLSCFHLFWWSKLNKIFRTGLGPML